MTHKAIRIQFVLNGILQAEVIVSEFTEAKRVSAAYAIAKLQHGSSAGSTVMRLARLPRLWNVPVGTRIDAPGSHYEDHTV